MEIDASLKTAANGVTLCQNLRLWDETRPRATQSSETTGKSGNTLVPAGHPEQLISDTGFKPFARVSVKTGTLHDYIFLHRGLEYRIYRYGDSDEYTSGTLPGLPVTAMYADGVLTVMTEAGVIRWRHGADGAWEELPDLAPSVPLALVAEDCDKVTVFGGDVALYKTEYDRFDTALGYTDATSLTRDALTTYKLMDATVRDAGHYLQPMLGFYRLLDGEGGEIYRSCPVALAPSCGLNLISHVTATAANGRLSLYTLDAVPYTVKLRLNCDPTDTDAQALLRSAATVEVCLSPQMHPLEWTGRVENRVEINSDGDMRVTFSLPGNTIGLNSRPEAMADTVVHLLCRLDNAVTVSAQLPVASLSFSAAGDTVEVSRTSVDDAEAESASIARLKAQKVAATDEATASLAERIAAPHTFTAAAGATNGQTVLWAGLTPRLFDGYRCAEMARSVAVAPSSLFAATEIASDGGVTERVIARDDISPVTPTSFGPLLCYPLCSATRLTVGVTVGGKRRELDVPLRTAPGCSYAFWLNPTVQPVALPAEFATGDEPGDCRADIRYPGAIATARVQAPLRPVASASASSGTVTAVLPATRTTAGWNFAHSRFYLFGTSGAAAVSVNSQLIPGTPVMLHEGAPDGECAPFRVPDGQVYAVCGGNLTRFDGARPATAVTGVRMAGYCAPFEEMWVLTDDGELRVYTADLKAWYTRTFPDVAALHTSGGTLLVSDADGCLLDASREEFAAPVPVAWESYRRVPLRRGPGRLLPLRLAETAVAISGSAVKGAVGISGGGGLRQATLVQYDIDGEVASPIVGHLVAPRLDYVSLRLEADVSADFAFRSFTIQ